MELQGQSQSVFQNGFNQQLDALFGGKDNELGVRVFCEFAEVFLGSAETRQENLSKSLNDGDFKQFLHLAHQLKGSLRTLGAQTLAEACQKIEDHCRQQAEPDLQLLSQWFEEIRIGLPGLTQELRLFLRKLDQKAS